ncbi:MULTISPECIES: hypothetical protein [Pseudofrankia]|uniref:hypothetical protein n=1 Tax=Pseudofrankia TaxID=2994363 RepID=UPI000234D3E9|nr:MULTISPECIES: hypothetical protein [Pseudofrankia]OHV27912.1 hypothetical protein BCD49_38450 [Pseudofrankia sp. EUN1h]
MAIPQVPDDVSKLDLAAVRAGYLKLANRDMRRLRKDALSRPDPYSAAEYRQLHDLERIWRDLPSEDHPLFLGHLRTAVAELTVFDRVLDRLWGTPSLASDTHRPVNNAEFAIIKSAVDVVDSVAAQVASGSCDQLIAEIFLLGGDSAAGFLKFVKENYFSVIQSLRRLLDETMKTTGSAAERRGFMIDPGLPANMPTLATGSGPGCFIRVRPAAMEGDRVTLAASLAHEGSHTVAGPGHTIDFLYKNSGAHYRLIAPLAVRNAANYEQLTSSSLQKEPSPEAYTPDPVGLAVDLIRTKVTRAWVQAGDLRKFRHEITPTAREKQIALNEGVPQARLDETDNKVMRRRQLATMLNALLAQVGQELADALFVDLYDGLSHHMDTIFKKKITLSTDRGLQVVVDGRPLGDPLPAWPNTLEDLVRHIVARLAEWQVVDGRISDAVPQVGFIDTIRRFEEVEFGDLLALYSTSLGRKYQRVNKPAVGPL